MTTIDHTPANTDHEAHELHEHYCYISDRRGALLSELGDSLRNTRAAYTIVHAIIAAETV